MQSNLITRDDIEIRFEYEANFLIQSFPGISKFQCLSACNLDCQCYMLAHDESTCRLYNQSALDYFMTKSEWSDTKIQFYVKK